MALPGIVACQSFTGNSRTAHRVVTAALDHVAIAAKRLLVEGQDLVLRVGGLVFHYLESKLPVAKTEVDVRRLVAVLVFLTRQLRAGIYRKSNIGGRDAVGGNVHATQRSIDLDVLVFAVLVLVHRNGAANGEDADRKKNSTDCESEVTRNAHSIFSYSSLYGLRPSSVPAVPWRGDFLGFTASNKPQRQCAQLTRRIE